MNTQRRANGTARINKSAPDFWIEGEPKRTRHEPPSGERKTLHFQNKYSSYARSSWIQLADEVYFFIQLWYHLQAKRVQNKLNSVTPLIRFQLSRNTQNGLGNSQDEVGFSDEVRVHKITTELTSQQKSQTDTRRYSQEEESRKTRRIKKLREFFLGLGPKSFHQQKCE